MKNIISLFLIASSALFFGQEKAKVLSERQILFDISPIPLDSWILINKDQGKDTVVRTDGTTISYIPQTSGFKLNPSNEDFYYIVFQKGNKVEYITNNESLKTFIGSIDSGEEAILAGILNGYKYDGEYKDYAGNFKDNTTSFQIEIGKVTNEKCPYQNSHFVVNVDKKTGSVTEEKNLGVYQEVYEKTCANNPHNEAVKKQMEEAKLKQEEDAKKAKEMREKARKQQLKSMRKNY